ncbi:peptide ABC transporter, permease protein [Campylobacter sputorum subsp. bubulus]|uniref:Peptide ABC transporter, permease protein n=1 Tax=Campylobacter sputorum subsp. sputorum TaxID=32024 RepID=A0A381DK41_9BACT|nr:ABC transporter permease [Campylobacter sputorum]ASM34345.1 dipeptide/oligopeptide/nickel ABC transporter, permease protein [Campylobacter sputorum aubsp. sputorum RM3237]ASM37694.1 dipeptide/oligopeptide/nickel ABC transporter, permease protein [Campylobacter sputorum bv. paraureolyticus LMG 11764]KAB0582264.1 ABC transporter permease [Campylobacter sputorum subsp. sputorum]MDY6120181.1 ABC transporter permease [Campylobacter sputorum]QEL04536.1 nickel ABC transporter, permease protein [Ca
MKKFLFAFLIIIVLAILALFAPFITHFNPDYVNLESARLAPNSTYIFGTDMLGRDILTRILYALRISLIVGFFSAFFSCFIGVIYAFLAAISPKIIDHIMMRIVDGFLAMPMMLFIMFFSAILDAGIINMIVVISLSLWMQTARVMRNEYEKISSQEFVKSAIVLGSSKINIIFKEILPNLFSILMVFFSINFAHAIATEAVLSFFGIGVPVGKASLGNMLNDSTNAMFVGAWWIIFYPGIVLFLLIICVLYIGNFIEQKDRIYA